MTDANRRGCVLALAAVLLAGCEGASGACRDAGGTWVSDAWTPEGRLRNGCYSVVPLRFLVVVDTAAMEDK